MVRKFPPFRSERKKRSTSEGTPQFPNGISGKLPYHLTSNRNFRIFWPNGKHPVTINLTKLPWVLESSERDMNTLNQTRYFTFTVRFFTNFSTRRLIKVRFHPMKGTNKSSLVLLSKKSAICDKLVNASNLKLLHGLSLKTAKLKLSKLFQFYFQVLTVFFILLQFTFAFVAYGRWNARSFVN